MMPPLFSILFRMRSAVGRSWHFFHVCDWRGGGGLEKRAINALQMPMH